MNYRFVLPIVMFATGLVLSGCATNRPGMGSMFAKSETVPVNNFKQEISLARLSERNGNGTTAKKIYRHILSEQPENRVALHRMGVIAGKEGQYDLAIEYLAKAQTAGQPSAEVLSDLGYVYYLQDNQEQAQQLLEEALVEDPDYEAARTNLAIVYAELGQYDLALQQFRRVGSEAEALSNLAYIQSQRGDIALAEQNYSRALDLDKRLRPAAEALVQIAQMTGEVTNRPNVRPHIVPPQEQPQQEMVAETSPIERNKNFIEQPQFVAQAEPVKAKTDSSNPLRTNSRFSGNQPAVQQVQYRSETQTAAQTTTVPTQAPAKSGLTIPTQSLGTGPAVYQISDQPLGSNVQQPPAASTQIGAVPSASAQDFSKQVISALETAAAK